MLARREPNRAPACWSESLSAKAPVTGSRTGEDLPNSLKNGMCYCYTDQPIGIVQAELSVCHKYNVHTY